MLISHSWYCVGHDSVQSNLESYVSNGLDGNGIETCLTTVLLSVHEAVFSAKSLAN